MRLSTRQRRFLIFLGMGLIGWGLTACQTLSSRVQDPKRSFEVKPEWIRSTLIEPVIGYRYPQLFRPIFYKSSVIVGNSIDNIASYDKDSGALNWRIPLEKGTGPATLFENQLYFGTLNGELLAVDADTGRTVWTYSTGTEAFSAPAVDEDHVYLLSSDGRFHVVLRENGNSVWAAFRPSRSTLTIRESGVPLLRGPHVAIGFPDGSFVKFDRKDGGVVWERQFDTAQRFQDVDSTAVFYKGDILVSSYEGGLYSLDWESGELNWNFKEGSPYAVLLHDSHIFHVTEKGRTYKIDPSNGQVIWDLNLAAMSAPLNISKSVLIQGLHSGDLIFREESTGRELARLNLFSSIEGPAVIDPETGAIFLMSGFANLYRLQAGWVSQQ